LTRRALTQLKRLPTMNIDANTCAWAEVAVSVSTPLNVVRGSQKIGQLAMMKITNSHQQRGFSLLEMITVVAIGFVIAGISFVSMMPLLNKSHIDTAYETALSVLRNTRHLAITQGHEYIVTINAATGVMTVQYQPPPPAGSTIYPPVQLVNTYAIPNDTSFAVKVGYPASTPDGFGTGVASIDFGYTPAGGAGGSSTIVFMPDGSARDGSTPTNGGNYSSGVLYVTRASGVISDSRAITVWGATGRIRGWRLNVVSGVNTWVQL
jgi:prepilin-type N-terminal cleavage/methylation domain-containing protein